MNDDPINFYQTMQSSNSQKYIDAMNKEMKSIKDNDVLILSYFQNLRNLLIANGYLRSKEFKRNIERYKTCLIIKGLTQKKKKKGIDSRDTFSSVSLKDSFQIIIALVAHFNLELH